MSIRIGSVPYLNARPLIRWFEHTHEGRNSNITVIEDTPSRLAQLLENDEISVAMVSSFSFLLHPEYDIVPNVSISGQGEIKSVRAFSKLPFRMLHSIAVDASSLTSVALLRILLAEVYDSHPQFLSAPPNIADMLSHADAALLIGDNGMLSNSNGLRVLDLGEEWRRHTGLPFTYAIWIAKPGVINRDLSQTLQRAKEWGLTQTDKIAAEEANRLGCPYSLCYEYLTEVMDYNLDDEHYQALDLFRDKLRCLGVLSTPSEE